MRILYLADSYRPSRSACANRTVVLVEELREAGHDVQVLTSSDSLIGASEDYRKPDYVTFFRVFPLQEKTLINRLKNNFGGQRESVRLAKDMGEFDVVVCTTPPLLLASSAIKIARKKRARLVLDVRDIWPDVAYEMGSFTPKSLYGRFFEHLANRAYRFASLVVSVSPGKVKKLESRVSSASVELIPNGIDESFLKGSEDKEIVESLRLNDGPICVYVGNIGLAQGLGTLLDIAAVRPNARFLLFGTGADRAKLEARVVEEGLENVLFCGTIDAAGVRTVLAHAALSYIPLVSSKLRDSIPTKLYEALACGCPVLLAAEGDSADLLDESGLGLHVAPENGAALLDAFDQLIAHPYIADVRIAASRWVVEHHSRQRFAASFAPMIESLSDE